MEVLSYVSRPFLLFFLAPPKTPETEREAITKKKIMEICVESFDGEKYTVEVGVDDTAADLRRKVASAAELCEDGFDMSFGGNVLAEGDGATQLSAGDTVVLTKTQSQKYDAIAALRDLGETTLNEERFAGLTDTTLIHLFLQAEVVTEIPSNCLRRGTFEEIDLSGVSGVAVIRKCFLSNCSSLRTVDLSGWSNVTQLCDGFLSDCCALTTVDLSGWNNLTTVGPLFLSNCSSVTALDLSGWNNVTQIEDYFLSHCSALRTLDLSGWGNVRLVGDFFLYDCSALRTLALSGWHSATQVGHYFLANCIALRTVDLSGWTSLTQIEPHFMLRCKIRTRSINVTGSSSVVSEYLHSRSFMDNSKCLCA